MNDKQMAVLWCAVAALILMVLFPPWLSLYPDGLRSAAGYGLIWAGPPEPGLRVIDARRMAMQVFALAALSALAWITAGRKH